MLFLCSDPRVAPVRWVNLSGVEESSIALVPNPSAQNENLSFARADGARNLAFRPRRVALDLSLNVVPGEEVEKIYELANLSGRNHSAAPVMCLPNLGPSTIFSAPLSRSTKAWKKNRTDHSFDISTTDVGVYLAGRYYLDEFNRLNAAGVGEPRFEPGIIGNALRNEKVWPNLISTSKPAGPLPGNPLWQSRAGAPTLAFDGGADSVVNGRTGADRMLETQTAVDTEAELSGTGTSQVGRVYGGIWVRGDGQFQVGIQEGALTPSYSTASELDPGRWQYLTHSLSTVASSGTFKLIARIRNSSTRLRAIYLDAGILWQTAGSDTLYRSPQHWNEFSSASQEITNWLSVPFVTQSQTWTVLTTVPTVLTTTGGIGAARLIEEGNSNAWLAWINGGAEFKLGGQTSDGGYPSVSYFSEGRPALLTGRFDAGGSDFSIRVALLNPDNKTIDVGSNTGASEPSTSIASYNSIRIPNASGAIDVPPSDALVQCARIDARFWSNDEVSRFEQFSLSPGFQAIRYATEGRLFEIEAVDLVPIPGRWEEYQGTIRLAEVDVLDPDLAHAI